MSVKLYLVLGPSGEYEDYFEETIGLYFKKENAEKAGKEWYDSKVNPNLPMTLERFEELSFGYADDDYEEEGPRGRDGFTKSDFEKMDEAWENKWTSFYEPIIRELEIQDISEFKELFEDGKL